MADLTTVAAVKQWLGVTSADHDTLLASLVSGVSAWIQSRIERVILSAVYAETRNGDGRDVAFVVNTPLTAVSSVKVNGVAIPARAAYGQSGFSFDEDCIYLEGYCFTRGRQNVQLGYTSGLAAVPDDLNMATMKLCAIGYRERERIGLSSKGLNGEQTNFLVKVMPEDVRDVIDNYRRVVPV